MNAGEKLAAEGIGVRIVSMPSWELFDEQPQEYRERILTSGVPILAVEAAWPDGWYKYVGEKGDVIGLNRFGASAPGDEVMKKLGFSPENVIEKAKSLMGR
jgi:transketolase